MFSAWSPISVQNAAKSRAELRQPARQLALDIALVLVRVPSADIRKRRLDSKVCFQ